MSIADAVRLHRERAGLSQSALARIAGVSQSLLSRIESGANEGSVSTLRALAAGLGVSILALVEGQRPECAPVSADGAVTADGPFNCLALGAPIGGFDAGDVLWLETVAPRNGAIVVVDHRLYRWARQSSTLVILEALTPTYDSVVYSAGRHGQPLVAVEVRKRLV